MSPFPPHASLRRRRKWQRTNNTQRASGGRVGFPPRQGVALFRFTIRDLLWLMVMVGMAVGWWLTIRRQSREIEQAYELVRSLEEQLRRSKQLEDPFRRTMLQDSN